jgi:hypothetical protein
MAKEEEKRMAMDKHSRRRHDAHRSALKAATENRKPIEASPGGTKALADLTTQVADVNRLSADQSDWLNEMRKAFKSCRELRRTLYDMLKAVVKISASVVLEKESAELMKLPRIKNSGTFIDDARAIWNVVAKYRQPFLDAGLALRVFDDLPQLIDDLVAAKDSGRSARQHIGLTVQDITERLNDGDKAIGVIDAILATSPEANPNAVDHLRMAKRVGPAKAKTPEPAAAPPVTATPTAKTA